MTSLAHPLVRSTWRDYLELCKPRVVLLMLLTALVGMYLAHPGFVPYDILISGLIGIGLCASSAASINHLVDRHIDTLMQRTQARPIARGRVSIKNAIIFAIITGTGGFLTLLWAVNLLTAGLTVCTLIGYAGIYTGYLKRATPQNIVIGGLAGAAPPLLGWTCVTNHLDPQAFLLVLIIFTWTPPHFWALSVYRLEEYRKANIPMLPVTHGIPYTKLNILLYTILLILVSILPVLIHMSGWIYLLGSSLLNLRFLYCAVALYLAKDTLEKRIAYQTFRYSILYLLLLFIFLLIDHYF